MKYEFKIIKPAFKNQLNVIAVSSSSEYAPYLAVYLQSLIDNANDKKQYDIVVFSKSISESNKQKIRILEKENISIRFYDPSEYFANVNLYISNPYFKEECYYRVVAPNILSLYNKVLFTDLDLIIKTDILNIFDISIDNNIIGCSIEPYWYILYDENVTLNNNGYLINIREYCKNNLNTKNPLEYYNTGVCLIDIKKFIEFNSFEKLLKCINDNKFLYQEQDAINVIFKGKIFKLPEIWNFELLEIDLNKKYSLNVEQYINNYNKNESNAKILHFLGAYKPWIYPNKDKVNFWWIYARKSPFYEEIIEQYVSRQLEDNNKLIYKLMYINNHKILFSYKKIKYFLKSKLLHSKKQHYYLKKYLELCTYLNKLKQFKKL